MSIRIACAVTVPRCNLCTSIAVIATICQCCKQVGQVIVFHTLAVVGDVLARSVAIQHADIKRIAINDACNVFNDGLNKCYALWATKSTEGGVGMKVGAAHLTTHPHVWNEISVVAVQHRTFHDGGGKIRVGTAIGVQHRVKCKNPTTRIKSALILNTERISLPGDDHVIVL